MHLLYFDSADTSPHLLEDRDEVRAELRAEIEAWMQAPDTRTGRSWAIIGEQGVGKSILTRAIIDDIKAAHSATTVTLRVDCRSRDSWKGVLRSLIYDLVRELDELRSARATLDEGLYQSTKVLAALARFDSAELREVHEHLVQFKAAASFSGKLGTELAAGFDILLRREQRDIKTLAGKITVDEEHLGRALCALLEDVSTALRVVVYIDNIDELDHNYATPEDRARVRRQVDGILQLRRAPVALLLNARTYFSGAITRVLPDVRRLEPLGRDDLLAVLDRRLERESDDIRRAVAAPPAQQAIARLAEPAPTAHSLLALFEFLFRRGRLDVDQLQEGLDLYLRTFYGALPVEVTTDVIHAFPGPDAQISRDQLEEACGGPEIRVQLERLGIVFPLDFWSPSFFTLAPTLQCVLSCGLSR